MKNGVDVVGTGKLVHLLVAIAALSMDSFPFAHLGDLPDLPAQTPSPQDWAAVGMSPPRNPAKRQDTKDTPEAMRRRREQKRDAERRRQQRHVERCERDSATIREKTALIIDLTREVDDLSARLTEAERKGGNYWHEKTHLAKAYDEVDAKRAELSKQLERTRDHLETTEDDLDGAQTALMYERGRNKSLRAREKALEKEEAKQRNQQRTLMRATHATRELRARLTDELAVARAAQVSAVDAARDSIRMDRALAFEHRQRDEQRHRRAIVAETSRLSVLLDVKDSALRDAAELRRTQRRKSVRITWKVRNICKLNS